MRIELIFACLLAALAQTAGCQPEHREARSNPIRVAAAADLAVAFDELGRLFEGTTGQAVVFSYGSTGLLARQLREGAPFDLFAAANVAYVDEVGQAGACDLSTKAYYARGRLAVWSKRGPTAPPESLDDLADPRFRRMAIANPAHAPYGQAAKQALERGGVWGAVESRLVLGENVRQALQFAETGNAEVAVVALSLVVNDHENPWQLVDDTLHLAIDQAMVACSRGENRSGGEAFARFVSSEQGRAVMRRHGFLLPGERLTENP